MLRQPKDWMGWVYETMKTDPSYAEVVAACHKRSPELDQAGIKYMADQVHSLALETVGIAFQNNLMNEPYLEGAVQKIKSPTLLLWGEWQHGSAVRPGKVVLTPLLIRYNVHSFWFLGATPLNQLLISKRDAIDCFELFYP